MVLRMESLLATGGLLRRGAEAAAVGRWRPRPCGRRQVLEERRRRDRGILVVTVPLEAGFSFPAQAGRPQLYVGVEGDAGGALRLAGLPGLDGVRTKRGGVLEHPREGGVEDAIRAGDDLIHARAVRIPQLMDAAGPGAALPRAAVVAVLAAVEVRGAAGVAPAVVWTRHRSHLAGAVAGLLRSAAGRNQHQRQPEPWTSRALRGGRRVPGSSGGPGHGGMPPR